MPGSFDPYHKWLGISPKDQPPNHYRLLAIDLFEADPDVISSAADQRMSHVRAFQTGKHSAVSQRILNEIAAARVCLLDPEKKAVYDRQLREQTRLAGGETRLAGRPPEPTAEPIQAEPRPVPASPQPPMLPLSPLPSATPPLDEPVPPRFEGSLPRPWRHGKGWVWRALTAVLVAAVISLTILIAMTTGGRPQQVARPGVPPGSDPNLPNHPTLPSRTENPTQPGGASGEKQPPAGLPEQTVPPEKIVLPENPEPPDAIAHVIGVGPVEPPTASPGKLAVPDAAARAAAESRLKATLANAAASELLTMARAGQRPAEERYVLLTKARDLAAGSGDIEAAMAATDEMVRQFEVDPLQAKMETFIRLSESATTPSLARAVAEHGLTLVDEAVAAGNREVAREVGEKTVGAARTSDDNDLYKRAVKRFLSLGQSP
jgi:hypothetical protein